MFPLIEGDEFDALVEDIREHGLREPITILDGKILDGRNRYYALSEIDPGFSLESAPKMFVEFDGDDPLEFVISKNLHRRQLSASQRAMVAANITEANLKQNGYTPGLSLPNAAKMMNVAVRTVSRARKILKTNPTLAKQIETGKRRVGEEPGQKTISVVLSDQEYDQCVKAANAARLALTTWMRKILLEFHLGMVADTPNWEPSDDEAMERNLEIVASYMGGITLAELSKRYGLSLSRLSGIVNGAKGEAA